MNRSLLEWVGLGFISWYALSSFTSKVVENVSFQKAMAQNFRLTGDGISFLLNMTFLNDLPFDIPSNNFSGRLFFGNTAFANVETGLIEMKADQSTTVPVNVTATIQDIGTGIIDVIQTRDFLRQVRLKGTLFSNGVSVPVDTSLI